MRRLAVLLAITLLTAPGCLSANKGLVVVISNETDTQTTGTLQLRNPQNETITTHNFTIPPNEKHVTERLTRDPGRFTLNITLHDGRTAQADVHGGGTLQDPQITIRPHQLHIFQLPSERAPGYN